MLHTSPRTTCPACEGTGTQNDGNPNDPRSRLVICDECDGTGLPTCDACAAQDGDSCEGSARTCAVQHLAALDAGIPIEVIRGEKTLRQCFGEERIDIECGRVSLAESMAQARLLK